MKVAVICTHAGAPGTLATTAFIRALMDGLERAGATGLVVGLARHKLSWIPETMEPYQTAVPWLAFDPTRPRDVIEAARRGVFGEPCPQLGGPSDWHLELLLERALEEFAAGDDLIVMFYPRVYMMLKTCARICRRRGWRFIVISTEALSDAQIEPSIRDQFIQCAVRCSDGGWVLSDHLSRYWQEAGVPANRIYVKPPPVRRAAFDANAAWHQGSVVYIGNLEHREIDYLLDVSAQVRPRTNGYHLSIYGDSSETRRRKLLQQIRALGLQDVISVMQSVPPADVPSVLATAQVLVLPRSRGEFSSAGFPNKLGEYLASGRPVVVTAVGDIPQVLAHEKNALLVVPDDPTAFAGAVLEALENRVRSEEIGAAGKVLAAEVLASDVVARGLLEFVKGIPPRLPMRALRHPWAASRRAVLAGIALPLRAISEAAVKTARTLGLNRSGQYGWMLIKRGIVSLMRTFHLWPEGGINKERG